MSVAKTVRLESPFQHADEVKPTLSPDRIRCARETAGLSKVQLAEALNVTTRTIANYEEDGAPSSKGHALAEVLGVRPSFFSVLSNEPAIEDLSPEQVWFRSLRKSTVKQRKSAVGHGRNALLFFRWIEDHFRLPEDDLPVEDGVSATPAECAMALRGDWGYGENALPSILSLAESHGIRVFSMPDVGREVDAFSFVFGGVPYIAVDMSKTPERRRFDIAHEIGHLVMHATSLTESERGLRDVEKEAHEFASNLLMPRRRFKAMVGKHASLSDIFKAKRYFGVAAMAVAYRAHALGQLTDWEYRSVCSYLSAHGYKSGEPKGIKPETSQVFEFVARSNRDKGISTNTIAEETGLSSKELHGLSFGNLMAVTGKNGFAMVANNEFARPQLKLLVNEQMAN